MSDGPCDCLFSYFQSISLLVYLCGNMGCQGPFLVLSPLSVLNNWETELTRFAPHLRVLNYSGGKEVREKQRQEVSDHITEQVSTVMGIAGL